MNAPLHLILGDGSIGLAVADELRARGIPFRLASRTPPEDAQRLAQHRRIDALDRRALVEGTADATHVHVTLGLPYDTRVWQRDWPPIVENLLTAARANGFRLVFFDNVYPYGPAPLQVPMREDHPQRPPSRKGAVRKALDDALERAMHEEGLPVIIARSADFYGPGVRNSALYVAGIARQLRGQAAQWMGDPDRRHSFTYTPDAARGMVALALAEDTWGQAWHLPTQEQPITARALLARSAALLGAPTTVQTLPAALLWVLKYFVPVLRELDEMNYQNTNDYVFSSEKFMQRFPDFRCTSYEEGIAAMVQSLRQAASPGAR
jgi:nucleoside-diphosphate-sugar epimerase